jgi:glycosyltransferase involved in cell wall biosynthesis
MIAAPQRSVTVLIAARSYQDGRKNEQWLIDFIRQFPTTLLKVTIIGVGWWSYVAELQQAGYTVEYHDDFNRDTYRELLKVSDYLLVAGFDEGALSTLDAILYDVTPIVSAQGYHLEQSADMLLFANHEQLMAIARTLKRSLEEKSEMSRAMTDWDAFALKHFELWKSLTS